MGNHTEEQLVGTQSVKATGGEITMMDLMLVVARHNRFIIKLTVAVAVLAVAGSLLMANRYTAVAVIMPPQQSTSTANALLGQLGGLAGNALGGRNPSDLYVGMLKSRSVADAMIQRFKLMDLYHAKKIDVVRAALGGATVISVNKDNSIKVEYTDKDPKRAAEIANAYVEELNGLLHRVAASEALDRRQFYGKQLNEVKAALAHAELDMKNFQEKNRVFRLGSEGGMMFGASGGIPGAELEYVRLLREVKYQETLLGLMAQQVTTAAVDAAKDTMTVQVMDAALPPETKSRPKRALIVIFATLAAFFVGVVWAFIKEAGERARQIPERAERMALLVRYLRKGK